MAQITKCLYAISNYMKRVKLSISMVLDLVSTIYMLGLVLLNFLHSNDQKTLQILLGVRLCTMIRYPDGDRDTLFMMTAKAPHRFQAPFYIVVLLYPLQHPRCLCIPTNDANHYNCGITILQKCCAYLMLIKYDVTGVQLKTGILKFFTIKYILKVLYKHPSFQFKTISFIKVLPCQNFVLPYDAKFERRKFQQNSSHQKLTDNIFMNAQNCQSA